VTLRRSRSRDSTKSREVATDSRVSPGAPTHLLVVDVAHRHPNHVRPDTVELAAQRGLGIGLAHEIEEVDLVAASLGRGRDQRGAERQRRQVDPLGVGGDDENSHCRLWFSISRVYRDRGEPRL
jgi:hypothetical protein